MGKASSSKKVARAAGTGGGRTSRARTPWSFFGVLAVIVVLGVVFTVTSRSAYESSLAGTTAKNAKVAPTVGGTPWLEGYAVDVCGHFEAPISAKSTKTGITTDGNGVIHIAPKVASAAGKNATLGVFAQSVGMVLTADEVKLPGGKAYINGDDCGHLQADLYVKQYPYAGAPKGTLVKQDPATIRLADDALVTIAFVPPSQKDKIPAPPASVQRALTASISEAVSATTTTPAAGGKSTTSKAAKSTSSKRSTSTKKSTSTRKSTSGKTAKHSST